ncbi:hypothetical protein ACWCQQ_39825 [Streptomyces sp. NPDC002143]
MTLISARSRAGAVAVGTLLIATVFGLAAAPAANASTSTTVQGKPDTISYATCPAGTHLIGGGYSAADQDAINAGAASGYAIWANHPVSDPEVYGENTWFVAASFRVVAFALCETNE